MELGVENLTDFSGPGPVNGVVVSPPQHAGELAVQRENGAARVAHSGRAGQNHRTAAGSLRKAAVAAQCAKVPEKRTDRAVAAKTEEIPLTRWVLGELDGSRQRGKGRGPGVCHEKCGVPLPINGLNPDGKRRKIRKVNRDPFGTSRHK